MVQDLLKEMHAWLNEEHFTNKINKGEDAPPFITALLGPDKEGRERTLTIRPLLQETGQRLTGSKETIVSLEFSMEMPFKLDSKAEKDMASLLHFLNGELYLPGFHLEEAYQKILFRHVNFSLITGIDKKVLIGLTGLILLYLDLYARVIEDVATGKKTFNDVIDEVVAGAS